MILLYRPVYVSCDFKISVILSFSSNDLSTRGNGLKINTEQFDCTIRRNFGFNTVANGWNDLPHPAVTAVDTKHFKNQFNNEETSKTIEKNLRSLCWCIRLFVLIVLRFDCSFHADAIFFLILCSIFLYFPMPSLNLAVFVLCIVCILHFGFCANKVIEEWPYRSKQGALKYLSSSTGFFGLIRHHQLYTEMAERKKIKQILLKHIELLLWKSWETDMFNNNKLLFLYDWYMWKKAHVNEGSYICNYIKNKNLRYWWERIWEVRIDN